MAIFQVKVTHEYGDDLIRFSASADNQHFSKKFQLLFFRIPLKSGIYIYIYIYRFSGSVNLLALSVFMSHRKRGFVLSILINRSYFQLNALKHSIYRFLGSASLLALSIFMCVPNRGYSGHLIIHLRLLA